MFLLPLRQYAQTPVLVLDGHLQRHVVSAGANSQAILVENLIVGETYTIIVPEDPTLGACWPDLSTFDLNASVLSYDPMLRVLRFTANAPSLQFQLDYACTWDADNPPRHYVSVVCETCKKKKLKDYLESVAATLEVAGGDAETLVRETLIGGDCFDVTGITYSGNGGQIGTFSQGQTNIGFSQGMIMATGDISVAVGPNDQDNASAGYGISTPDSDLSALSGSGSLFDRASIEFDFTPTQSPLTFEFVFASEEYCEYVGSQFNDAFGFFISGPGINGPFGGSENIASIPLTNPPVYVAINNINHLSNTGLYVNNTGPNGTLCGQNPSFLPAVNEVQFDGFTRKMVATANVQPCQTYHIKLKICDVGDGIFDSAVFLRSGSFDAGGNVSVDFVVNGDPDLDEVYEGCGTVQLIFDRVGGNINVPLPVNYTIFGTATPGVDYAPIPGAVVIPAGSDKLILNVTIFNDALLEGDETIVIKLSSPCSCVNPEETLIIKDLPVLDAVPDTVVICGAGVGVVGVNPVSGVEPYTYQWSTGSTDQQISPFVSVSTNYRVTVTDACGKTLVETARVIVSPLPNGQMLPPAPQLCPGQSAIININFNGVGPWNITYNLNGDPQTPIEGITQDPYQLEITQPGLYQLTSVTDSLGCTGPGQGAILVQPSTLAMTGVVTNAQCHGSATGAINTTVTGGQGPYNYTWTGPSTIGNIPDPVNILAGAYTVTVTDGFGCTNVQNFTINQNPPMVPTVASVQGVNCANPNGGSITLSVTGGAPTYAFKWTGGSTQQSPQNLAAGNYTVTVTDQQGCTKTATATVPGDFTPPTAVAAVNDTIDCVTTAITLSGTGSSTGANMTYLWTANPGNIVGGAATLAPTVNQSGTYTLRVTNQTNGCTADAPIAVIADVTPPISNAGPNGTLTCVLTNLTLDGSTSSQGANFSYQWTASQGGAILSGDNTLTPVIGAPGTYTLVVSNSNNGCTTSDDALVNNNITPPNAVIAPPGLLTCTTSTVTLNGNGSTPGGNISFFWTTLNGNIQSGQATPNPVVSEAGQYTLIVTNNQNGCVDSTQVNVVVDYTDPYAEVNINGLLNCVTPQLTLNGSNSSNGSNYQFAWSAPPGVNFVSGQNTLTPVVNQPGTYTITVTNLTSFCTTTASILVEQDNQPPAADAGPPAILNCLTTQLMLGDTNAPIAPNLVYAWMTGGSGNITGGANTPTPTVNQPGTYTLLVTNTTNGCTSTDAVTIPQNITPPVAVVAPPAQLTCASPTIMLNGAGSSTGANFTYDWTSSTGGGIGAGGNTLTPVVTAAGTYTLLITNTQNGCTASTSVNVLSNANFPTAIATPSGIITCAQSSILVDGSGSSSGPNFTYQWSTLNGQIQSGGNTPSATVGAGGQYTLVVTNTTNNCSATFLVDVGSDLTPPAANAGPALTLNCTLPAQALDGSGSSQGPNYTYQWSPLTPGGSFASATNILNPSVNAPGTYQLLVTNTDNGCTATDEVIVVQDANDPVVQIANPASLTCAVQQIALNANGSSSSPTMLYSWTGPGIVSGGATLNPIVNIPGAYTLVITNTDNGCTTDQTINVPQDILPPPADAGPPVEVNCYTPQQQLGGPGNPSGNNYSFQWTGPGILSGAATPNAVVNQGGNYVLVVTNTTNGCTSTTNVNVAIDVTAPQADAGTTFQLTCVQNQYTLNATASQGAIYTYQWTTNTGNFLTPANALNPTVNGAGTYTLLVTNTDNGCTGTDQVLITQSADVPIALAVQPGILTCAVTTIQLNGAGSSTGTQYSYSWYPDPTGNVISGANTLVATADQPGVYTLAVTDNTNNCVSYTSITVDQDIAPPTIDAGPSPTLTCAAPSLPLAGSVSSTGNLTYQWQTQNGSIQSGAGTLTPTVNAGGTYVLTVTNLLNGCTNTDDVLVNVDQTPPTANIQPAGPLTCALTQLNLNASASSTGANYQYTWTTSNGNIVDQTTMPLQPLIDDPGAYTLLITNTQNGCTQTASVTVGQDVQAPAANAGNDGLLTCAVTSLVLNGNGSSQGSNFFYQWSTTGNGQILTGANTLTPTITAGGQYTLVVVNNANGCSSTDQVTVNTNTQAPLVVIAPPGVISCTQSLVTLNGTGSQTGVGISYAWSTLNGHFVGGQTGIQAVVDVAADYTLTVLNAANGCTNSQTVTVDQNIVLPIAEAGPPFTLTCAVEQVNLQATASTGPIYNYSWTTAGGQIVSGANSLAPVVNEPGTYTLLVLNTSTGCTQTDQVEVFVETNVPTGFAFTVDKPSCRNDDGAINVGDVQGGVEPFVYSLDGQNYFPSVSFEGLAPGPYLVWIQDVNGCDYNQTVNVPAAPQVSVDLPPTIDLVFGDSVKLNALLPPGFPLSLIDTVIWAPLDGLTFRNQGNQILNLLQPWAKPYVTTRYKVTVITTDGGCESADLILIRVDNEPAVYIPNAFSPWDEGDFNDKVFISAKEGQVKNINFFRIYDRWGELVFEDNDFLPNDPANGWDGRLRGKLLTPAVFVYAAEVEFIDGRVILYKGDVTLVR